MSVHTIRFLVALALIAAGGVAAVSAHAGPRARSVAHTGVNHAPAGGNRGGNIDRSANVNRNANINRNTNVNVHNDINVDVDNHWHDGWYDHPVATAAAVTATAAVTAAVIGSVVNSVPPSCVTTVVNGIAYQQCGSTWYQPQYAGTNVQYVVVNPPG